MEIKNVNSAEFKMRERIFGRTQVIHNIRVSLKLSCEEYVLLDFIYNWNIIEPTSGICFLDYYKHTGFLREDIEQLFKILKDKKLLVFDEVKKRVDVGQEWKSKFETNHLFEQLWAINPIGNKNTARQRFNIVVKKVDYELLLIKLKEYVKFCDSTGTFKKHLASWLNVKNEHWNDKLVTQVNKKSNQPERASNVNIKFK